MPGFTTRAGAGGPLGFEPTSVVFAKVREGLVFE